MGFRETAEFQQGQSAERRIARMLQSKGFFVNPSYDYSGEDGNKAPRLEGKDHSFVVPDLDASRDGVRLWVEVKSKSKPVVWGKTGEIRHGIELRHFWSYRQIEKITGSRVFLVVVEENSGEVLCASLSKLARAPISGKGTKWAEKMVFWPRDTFSVIGAVETYQHAIGMA